MAPTVSLVIPAYEEERRIPELAHALQTRAATDMEAAGLELLEAIVVDDGSTDGTAALLRAAAADLPLLRPVVYPGPNRGKGHAAAIGVAEARGDLVLLTDVDLAAPLSETRKLTDALRAGAGVAVGSRALARENVRTPLHRRVVGRIFNLLVRGATGLNVRDTQCGFKLLEARWARALLADQVSEGYAFDVELLMRAQAAGLRIAEVPVAYDHDRDSRVSVATASAQMARDVVRLWWALRVRSPDTAVPAGAPQSPGGD
jgi:dolichyl-phosphate beta-glucosyltransferase